MGQQQNRLACQLMDARLRERKEGIVAQMGRQLLDKQEIADGYVYSFPGDGAGWGKRFFIE